MSASFVNSLPGAILSKPAGDHLSRDKSHAVLTLESFAKQLEMYLDVLRVRDSRLGSAGCPLERFLNGTQRHGSEQATAGAHSANVQAASGRQRHPRVPSLVNPLTARRGIRK